MELQDYTTRQLAYLIGPYDVKQLHELTEETIELRKNAIVELQSRYGSMAHIKLTGIIKEYLAKKDIC